MTPRPPRSASWRAARRGSAAAASMLAAVLLAACGAPGPLIPEQQSRAGTEAPLTPAPRDYRVAAGDTLYSIAFRYGLDWREVAAWNGIGRPYTIHVGDRLRLRPPPDMRAAARSPAPAREPASPTRSEPVPEASSPRPEPAQRPATAASNDEPGGARTPAPTPGPDRTEPSSAAPAAPASIPAGDSRSVGGVDWRWPTEGRIARAFDPSATRKGILIAGSSGQPIRAAAAGEVVYSGDGLIGYGQLVIIKHSDRMLSAYAHNRERLVAEGDRVAAGQVIGRMGKNERDETVLHFEIRVNGKPDNPLDFLPRR